jgi:hypothetical protein
MDRKARRLRRKHAQRFHGSPADDTFLARGGGGVKVGAAAAAGRGAAAREPPSFTPSGSIVNPVAISVTRTCTRTTPAVRSADGSGSAGRWLSLRACRPHTVSACGGVQTACDVHLHVCMYLAASHTEPIRSCLCKSPATPARRVHGRAPSAGRVVAGVN